MKTLYPSVAREAVIALGVAALVFVALGASSTKLSPRGGADPVAVAEYRDALRTALGREVVLARSGASAEEARQSADSVAAFIRARSGLALDEGTLARLAEMERRTLAGEAERITLEDLGATVVAVGLDRVRACTDDEIERATVEFGNVIRIREIASEAPEETARRVALARLDRSEAAKAVDGEAALEATPKFSVMLRLDGHGMMRADEFVDLVKSARMHLQSPQESAIIAATVRRNVLNELGRRAADFADAMPDRWGDAVVDGLTPVQALLVVYSAASDDNLAFRTEELRAAATRRLDAETLRKRGEPTAFGRNGMVFSSPLELAFDPATMSRLLGGLEERSAR